MTSINKNLATLLVFIICIQSFSIFLTNEFLISKVVRPPTYEPFGNVTPAQASSNTLLLLGIVIILTTAMIAIIKIFGRKLLKYLFLVLSAFLILGVNDWYVSAILKNHFMLTDSLIPFITSLGLVALVVYATLTQNNRLLLVSAFIILAEVGSFLAQVFVPPTLYAVLIGFALYDAFAVFYGPLKYFVRALGFPKVVRVAKSKKYAKGVETKLEKLKRELNLGIILVNVGGVLMGSGDLVFYSLIASSAFMLGGFVAAVAVITAVVVGVVINAIILQRTRRVLPGLTIPILLAIIPFIILS